ncbi:MAG TPA: hypothetical protein VF442_00755 [Sphingobium sp.]
MSAPLAGARRIDNPWPPNHGKTFPIIGGIVLLLFFIMSGTRAADMKKAGLP